MASNSNSSPNPTKHKPLNIDLNELPPDTEDIGSPIIDVQHGEHLLLFHQTPILNLGFDDMENVPVNQADNGQGNIKAGQDDGRIHSLPRARPGDPYTCYKCLKVFFSPHCFSAHVKNEHLKNETPDQKVERLRKRQKRKFEVRLTPFGVTVMPVQGSSQRGWGRRS